MIKYSVVYPCYRERESLLILIDQLSNCIQRDDIEIIFVENGSKDESDVFLTSLSTTHSWMKVVQLDENAGYGGGILRGLAVAQGSYVGWSHADLQCSSRDILSAIEVLETISQRQNVFIKGKRYGRPLIDRFFTFGMSVLESILFAKVLFDINAQPTMMSRDLYLEWNQPPTDFSIDLYAFVVARRLSAKVCRFPVLFGARKFGQSSWNTGILSRINFIKRTLRFSFELKLRNLK